MAWPPIIEQEQKVHSHRNANLFWQCNTAARGFFENPPPTTTKRTRSTTETKINYRGINAIILIINRNAQASHSWGNLLDEHVSSAVALRVYRTISYSNQRKRRRTKTTRKSSPFDDRTQLNSMQTTRFSCSDGNTFLRFDSFRCDHHGHQE